MFQQRLGSLLKQSMNKEKDFQETIQKHSEDVKKSNQKKTDFENQISQSQVNLRSVKDQIKENKEKQDILNQAFSEQMLHKEDIYSKTLDNKDKLINDVKGQLAKQQQIYEKQKSLRIQAENELREKEQVNVKLNEKIDSQKKLVESKAKNPEVDKEIERAKEAQLQKQKQLEDLKKRYEQKANEMMEVEMQKNEKAKQVKELDKKKEQALNMREDAEYLQKRIDLVTQNNKQLEEQKQKIHEKLQKKKGKVDQAAGSSDELKRIIQMLMNLTEYERQCQVLDDQLRDVQNVLMVTTEEAELTINYHSGTKDKLFYTLGKQKGKSSTGGLGYILKHNMIERKLDEFRDELNNTKSRRKELKTKLEEKLSAIYSKNFEKVTKQELEDAIQTNSEVKHQLQEVTKIVKESEKQLENILTDYNKFNERVKQSFIIEVKESSKLSDEELEELSDRSAKIVEVLKNFDGEVEKQSKVIRKGHKERAEEINKMKGMAETIKEQANEVKTNISNSKNQQEKTKKNYVINLEGLTWPKLIDCIKQLRLRDNQIQSEGKDVNDVERRTSDLSIWFRDLVKTIIKDLHQELSVKIGIRSKNLKDIQMKTEKLQDNIDKRKEELVQIEHSLEDEDQELMVLFKKYESILSEVRNEEESVSGVYRSLSSQIDRLERQAGRVTRENLNQEEVGHLLDSIEAMEGGVVGCQTKIEDALVKSQKLESLTKNMEKKIKSERINDCERTQKITFDMLEKLNRTLARVKTQLNVIEKDQRYLVDEFIDNEKKKESLAFKQEAEKKHKEYQGFDLAKDKLKTLMELQEKVYDEKQRTREQVSANDFKKIKKETDKIKAEIQKVLDQISGEYNQELDVQKEVIEKIVKKYRVKKEKYGICMDLKMTREGELAQWKDRLLIMKDRIQLIEGQLNILGVSDQHEGVELYQKFLKDIERLRQNNNLVDKAIKQFQERIQEEGEDLDLMENKIVKTLKLEDIEKAMTQLGIQIQNYEKEIEKFDLLQKQVEKEVEAFMNQIRSSQIIDCEQKIKEVDELIDKFIKRLGEVSTEVNVFKEEVMSVQDQTNFGLENQEQLIMKSRVFVEKMDKGEINRDSFKKQMEQMKHKLNSLDKKNISMNEIYQLLNDAEVMNSQTLGEIKKANDVKEELRNLNQQWKEKNKVEGERQEILKKIREQMKSNQDLLQQVKVLIETNKERVGQFDQLYKAMGQSEDYTKMTIDKKSRRIAQLRSDCGKYQDNFQECSNTEQNHMKIDLDNIESIDELTLLLKESEKVKGILEGDSKELRELEKKLDKKRSKLQDAEIRKLSKKRLEELQQVKKEFDAANSSLQNLEEKFEQRQSNVQQANQSEQLSPDRKNVIKQAIVKMKWLMNQCQENYTVLQDDIHNASTDISCRDLENTEPIPKLVRDIEKLKKQSSDIKELRNSVQGVKVELQSKHQMLSSMDTEKRLKQLIVDTEKERNVLEEVKVALNKVRGVSKAYEGYTSGEDDEEFFQVLYEEGQELYQELKLAQKHGQDLYQEMNKLVYEIADKKGRKTGMSSDEIEEFNDQIASIEHKYNKLKKNADSLSAVSLENKEKVSQHDLENKLDRRGGELEELDRLINNILEDNETIKTKVKLEIEGGKDDELMQTYCQKLAGFVAQADHMEALLKSLMKVKDEIQRDQAEVRQDVTEEMDQRIESMEMNLALKKRIQECLKKIGDVQKNVKDVFSKANEGMKHKPKEKVEPLVGFDPNDEVDKMFGQFLNKLGISILIKKLGGGYYLFGTKKIFCKISNGKLVVRVGGGYMGIEEFIMQYGASEAKKAADLDNMTQETIDRMQGEKGSRNSFRAQRRPTFKASDGSPKASTAHRQSAYESASFLKHASSKKEIGQAVEEAKKNFKDEEVKAAKTGLDKPLTAGAGRRTTTTITKTQPSKK